LFNFFDFFLLNFLKDDDNFPDFQFVPSVESNEVTEKFLSAHPQTLVEKAARVPIITGVNQMEGLVLFVGKF
jgi:hypothetical protein